MMIKLTGALSLALAAVLWMGAPAAHAQDCTSDTAPDELTGAVGRSAVVIRLAFPEEPNRRAVFQEHGRPSPAEISPGRHQLRFEASHQSMGQLGGRRFSITV